MKMRMRVFLAKLSRGWGFSSYEDLREVAIFLRKINKRLDNLDKEVEISFNCWDHSTPPEFFEYEWKVKGLKIPLEEYVQPVQQYLQIKWLPFTPPHKLEFPLTEYIFFPTPQRKTVVVIMKCSEEFVIRLYYFLTPQ